MGQKQSYVIVTHFYTAGITLATIGDTCSEAGCFATCVPEGETLEYIFEMDSTMTSRILVTYASRAGSTAEIATAIGETFRERNFNVDIRSVRDPPSNNQTVVIIGSVVRMGSE
jgi:menaquinone-dependent protoporphyrinogen oxidase